VVGVLRRQAVWVVSVRNAAPKPLDLELGDQAEDDDAYIAGWFH
jgi:hypothetical protein